MKGRWMLVPVVAAVVAAGGLTGCSGETDKRAAARTVIVPGRPGEPNRTITAGPPSATPPAAADLRFVQMMIPHHEQALEMAVLAPNQAANPKVRALAERIDAAQSTEISAMQSWLRQHGQRAMGHGGHAISTAPASTAPAQMAMPGMASAEQMAQLRQARGAAFDQLFLTLMITHHQGALTMARDALGHGVDVIVQEMAKDVLATQNAEINRMRTLLAG